MIINLRIIYIFYTVGSFYSIKKISVYLNRLNKTFPSIPIVVPIVKSKTILSKRRCSLAKLKVKRLTLSQYRNFDAPVTVASSNIAHPTFLWHSEYPVSRDSSTRGYTGRSRIIAAAVSNGTSVSGNSRSAGGPISVDRGGGRARTGFRDRGNALKALFSRLFRMLFLLFLAAGQRAWDRLTLSLSTISSSVRATCRRGSVRLTDWPVSIFWRNSFSFILFSLVFHTGPPVPFQRNGH